MNLNLRLNLKKPLVFLKVATTGMEPIDRKGVLGDRIIEISIIKVEVDRSVKSHTKLVNPGMPIPVSASKINGITDDMVVNSPPFSEIAKGLLSFIGDSDFAGFSISNFDIRFLIEEFNRAGVPFTVVGRKIVDLSTIYNVMEKRDFRSASSKFAGTTLNDKAISSETANNLSTQILNGMMASYATDLRFQNPEPESLHDAFSGDKSSLDIESKIVLNENQRPVLNFGKYKGRLVADIMISDPSYYDWCLNVSDLASDTKLLLKLITDKALAASSQNTQ